MFKIDGISINQTTFQPNLSGSFEFPMEVLQDTLAGFLDEDALGKILVQQFKEAIQKYKESKESQ